LITNHLTFALYNHIAIWSEAKAPKAFRTNGHVLLNNEKMSKSTGNFLSLSEAVDKYSADGTRFGLADSGDSLEDANFTTEAADNAVLRLYTQIKWTEEIVAATDMRQGPPNTFEDRVFESQINWAIVETDKHYKATNYREAVKYGFFDLQTSRDNYRVAVGSQANMNRQLVLRFIEVQALLISPICPHFAQFVWGLLGKTEVIQRARWPTVGTVNEVLLKQNDYLQEIIHQFRLRKDAHVKPKKGKKGEAEEIIVPPTKATIQVIKSFPVWMQKTHKILHPIFSKLAPGQVPDKKEIQSALSSDEDVKKQMKQIMSYVEVIKEDFLKSGMSALDLKMPFDEKAFLEESKEFIRKSLGLQSLSIEDAKEDESSNNKPGRPHISFSN